MSMLNIKKINEKNISLSVKEDSSGMTAVIAGKIDMPNPDIIISPFFVSLDKEILNLRLEEVYLDTTKLEFINSSGIKSILQLVMNIIKRPENDQYKIIIQYDKNIAAQKTRFDAIAFLAPNIIRFQQL